MDLQRRKEHGRVGMTRARDSQVCMGQMGYPLVPEAPSRILPLMPIRTLACKVRQAILGEAVMAKLLTLGVWAHRNR